MDSQASSGTGKEKDVMLEKGVDVLLEFGNYGKDNQKESYIGSVKEVFKKNGINNV